MAADYPKYNEKHAYPQAEAEMHRIMEAIRAIRNRRAEMNAAIQKGQGVCGLLL